MRGARLRTRLNERKKATLNLYSFFRQQFYTNIPTREHLLNYTLCLLTVEVIIINPDYKDEVRGIE